MKAIKNYSSDINIDKVFAELQRTLGEHGAKKISFEYNDNGKISGVSFAVPIGNKFVDVKLPAKVEKCQALLTKQWDAGLARHGSRALITSYDQAYRVTWRNILDWVNAQMALLDIEMARLEEVFLPYVVNQQGLTLFEIFDKDKFEHLPQIASGNEPIEGEIL